MGTTTITVPGQDAVRATKTRSIGMVFCCTILGAAAQLLFKIGSGHLSQPSLFGAVTLLAGLALYGINTVVLVIALKDGELSILYPIIALTYVWVTLLSMWVFHENINFFKAVGVLTIVAGVAVLGRSGKQ